MKKYDVVTVADMCVDLMVWGSDMVPDFEQKEKLLDGYTLEMGGSAPIFACQCGKLGMRTAVVGTVGNDMLGRLITERLEDSDVDVSQVIVRQDVDTALGIAMVKGNRRAILTCMGGMDATEPGQIPGSLLENTRHLHIASYFMLKNMRPYFPHIISTVKKAGGTVSLDTNWDPAEEWDDGLLEILPMVDLFMPNENELLAIMREGDTDTALRKAADLTGLCVVKRGDKGASALVREGEALHWGINDVPVVDTVGAGDTFDAGFIYGWLSDMPLKECGRIASYCSERNIGRSGGIAGQPRLAQMRAALYL